MQSLQFGADSACCVLSSFADLSSTRLLARTSAWRFNPAHVPCRTPQLPNFEEIWWVSAIGAATSLCYCTIALILGCVYAGNGYGSVGGLPGSSTADKVFQVGGIRLPAGCISAHPTVAS